MNTLHLAVVIASTRPQRLGEHVAQWFVQVARSLPHVECTVADLRELSLPSDLTPHPSATTWAEHLTGADAIVIVTPEYNHSFPGPLKTAIDTVKDPWRAAVVGFVSYGGVSGGVRAVEALRLVLAELHAVTVRDAVAIPRVRRAFTSDGQLIDASLPGDAATRMVEQLRWWSGAVQLQRQHLMYPS